MHHVDEEMTIDNSDNLIDRSLRLAFWCWAIATGFMGVVKGALYLFYGKQVFIPLMKEGPLSVAPLTIASVVIVWFALGLALALLHQRSFCTSYGALILCTLLVTLLYTNIMRERTEYGDVDDYIRAAHNLVDQEPFHTRYLYPPFLATILVPLLPLGNETVQTVCWAANLLALSVLSVLLALVLVRYGFGHRLSALLTFGFLMINVPVLRTLGYVQINMHVTNLILIALLCYPRVPILSALALVLAVHLKASPIILVLPFLLRRDWRWTSWFTVMTIGLVGLTFIPYGWRPFSDFLHNVQHIYAANSINFRENSVDSLFRCSAMLAGIPLDRVAWPIALTKLAILGGVLLTMARAMKNEVFVSTKQARDAVYNSVPVLMMFMLLGSPLLWEHHPVFVALPYLLMLKRLATPAQWVTYGFAFFLEYHLPTFDFFPWSFGRLVSPLVLIGLLYVTSKRTEAGSLWSYLAKTKASFGYSQAPYTANDRIEHEGA